MKKSADLLRATNSKGAAIFRKMLEDKKTIHEHLRRGGKVADLKDQFNFVKPISIKGV
jgi:hypothetical protein